jgi:molybdenum cofactor guanylyltransferase
MQSVLGVVLCGGKSSRMGRDKAMIRLDNGMTFIEHAINRLRPICNEVVLAGRLYPSTDVVILPDPTSNQGPIFGLLQAIEYATKQTLVNQQYEACLVTPVDMPRLTTSDLRAILLGWQTYTGLTYAVSGPERKRQPLVGIYPLDLHAAISLHSRTDPSLMRWIDNQRATQIALDESHCRNINRPEDLT